MFNAHGRLVATCTLGHLKFKEQGGRICGLVFANWDKPENMQAAGETLRKEGFLPTIHALDSEEEATTDPETDELEDRLG